MNYLTVCLLTTTLTLTTPTQAATVVGEEADTTIGKGIGGWAGVLIGGAAGGPVGALAAGFAGAWSGGEVQEATGNSGKAYRVKYEDGSERVVRSPNSTWQAGDQVDVVGNRLVSSTQ